MFLNFYENFCKNKVNSSDKYIKSFQEQIFKKIIKKIYNSNNEQFDEFKKQNDKNIHTNEYRDSKNNQFFTEVDSFNNTLMCIRYLNQYLQQINLDL